MAARGRTGRRPLPSAVKASRGERRQSRLNPREPKLNPGAPPKPKGLTSVASAEWDRLAELATTMGVLTPADGPALEATACAYEDYREARDTARREGAFYVAEMKSGDTMQRVHPAVRVAADAWRRYVAGLALFGLSPAMRSKVAAVPQQEKDDVELWLAGGREA